MGTRIVLSQKGIEEINNLAHVGIGCKNWIAVNPLYLEFTDLELQSDFE